MFAQYECVMPLSEQAEKYGYLCLITVLVLFVAFLYAITIHHLQTTTKLDKIKYDLSTVTLNDFTVEMDISKDDYQDFLDNHYKPLGLPSGKSPALYLKEYLKKKIEDIMSKEYQKCQIEEEE